MGCSDSHSRGIFIGQGDLFEQTYVHQPAADLSDRTKAAGPVVEAVQVTAQVVEKCHTW